MKTESKVDGNKEETKIADKNIENNDEKNKINQNNNKNANLDDPDFDINTFCPDPENADKKIRSKTVRESIKKGKLKQFIEEEKSNKIDPRKYLKTPQVMVPRLRPQKGKLNPTPLKLSSISLKATRLNSIVEEENAVQSEREEESENLDSSSSSFFDDDEKEEEEEKNDKNDKNDIIHEVEEDNEEEKEEEKEEIKEETKEEKEEEPKEDKDENEDKDKDKKIGEIEPCNDILGMLKKNEIKKEEDKNEEKAVEENILEENDEMPLMEMRKNMRKERKSFWKKKVDTFDVMDSNIKNNYKKFKEDVFDEKNNNDDTENKENLETPQKCCPILDFYAKNMSLKKKV